MSEKKCVTSFKKLILIGVLVGIISGLGAYLFFKGHELCTKFVMEVLFGTGLHLKGKNSVEITEWIPTVIWLILPTICGGALLSGLIVYFFAQEAEGHDTDAAIRDYHGYCKIRCMIPVVKTAASIITISTGGRAYRPDSRRIHGVYRRYPAPLATRTKDRDCNMYRGWYRHNLQGLIGGAILVEEIL